MSIASLITTSILEIATIEDRYFKTKLFEKSLQCPSKRALFEAYNETLEDLLVILGGFVQYFDIIKEDRNSFINNIHQIFKEKLKENIVKKEHISSKMVILFQLLIEHYENFFFEEIKNCYVDEYINYEKLLNIVFDLVEIVGLTLCGVRLSCENIKDSILNENCCTYLSELDYPTICQEICPFKDKGKDCLHIIVTNETIKIPTWADKILNVFASFYINPKNLSIYIDYKLVDKYQWDDMKFNTFVKYSEIFGGYYFVNAENVDFRKWISAVDIVPFSHLSSCILS